MTCAQRICPGLIYEPKDSRFTDGGRLFRGCPTVAVTRGGRIFLGWYEGGTREPHIDNFNLIVYSDDGGKTFSDPYLVIPGSRELGIHSLDIQLWISPTGALHVFWVQNHAEKTTDGVRPPLPETYPWISVDGYDFGDFEHSMWMSVCEDPDASHPIFDEPRRVDKGFLRCKPTVISNDKILFFNYDQLSERYGFSVSSDLGHSFSHRYGAVKFPTNFDEAMAYVRRDGSIRMLARTVKGCGRLAESVSYDGGESWSEAVLSNIVSPGSRFFVSRLESGRILLVHNDSAQSRSNMALYLSDDDGETFKYKRIVDTRDQVSYPDCDFFGGRIYLTYDFERCGAREILFSSFTEEDIMDPTRCIDVRVVSKPD